MYVSKTLLSYVSQLKTLTDGSVRFNRCAFPCLRPVTVKIIKLINFIFTIPIVFARNFVLKITEILYTFDDFILYNFLCPDRFDNKGRSRYFLFVTQ